MRIIDEIIDLATTILVRLSPKDGDRWPSNRLSDEGGGPDQPARQSLLDLFRRYEHPIDDEAI